MKKILFILSFMVAIQGMAETIVKGTYDTKKKRYVELSQDFVKEIKLDYVLPSDKKDLVTYKTENFDIVVRKSDLLELYNKNRDKKEKNIPKNYKKRTKKIL